MHYRPSTIQHPSLHYHTTPPAHQPYALHLDTTRPSNTTTQRHLYSAVPPAHVTPNHPPLHCLLLLPYYHTTRPPHRHTACSCSPFTKPAPAPIAAQTPAHENATTTHSTCLCTTPHDHSLYSQIIGSQITQNPQILDIITRLCTPSATSYPPHHYTTRSTSSTPRTPSIK